MFFFKKPPAQPDKSKRSYFEHETVQTGYGHNPKGKLSIDVSTRQVPPLIFMMESAQACASSRLSA